MNYKYNWEKHPEVIKFLDKIYTNTQKRLTGNKVCYIKSDEIAVELTEYLEDFLYIIESYNYNLDRVLRPLDTLEYFTLTKSDVLVQNYEPKIVLSDKLFQMEWSEEKIKAEKMNRRLYLYKGLVSHILKFKNKYTQDFSRNYSSTLGEDKVITNVLVNNGWLLLEEVLTDEIAERFTYMSLKKVRLFPTIKDKYYQIATIFGMTLNGVGSPEEHSSSIIMYDLTKKALNGDFSSEVVSEYIQKNNQFQLYQILYIMGLIFNEENKRFPYISLSEQEIKNLFKSLYILLMPLINLEQKEYNTSIQSNPGKLNEIEQAKMRKLIRDKKIENREFN